MTRTFSRMTPTGLAGNRIAPDLFLSKRAGRVQRLASLAGQGFLFLVTSASTLAVLFIFYYITKDALPFFRLRGLREFFTSTHWYPSGDPAEFGVLAVFVGSGLVTLGAIVVAVPLGVSAAVCLSDVLPFSLRQVVKPVIEILAAIPSVAFGFFALVVFAPLLQDHGGAILAAAVWCIGTPLALVLILVLSEGIAVRMPPAHRSTVGLVVMIVTGATVVWGLYALSSRLSTVEVTSGVNALNASIILGIMALPTVVSVSEDALQAAGRDLREGAYALGATRAEVISRVVIPAASSGVLAAVILGVMRAVGETMVVWMASGNAAQIPSPWFNFLQPVRTVTATIAGDMGEADHFDPERYSALFALALCLLVFSFLCNVTSEWVVRRTRRKLG